MSQNYTLITVGHGCLIPSETTMTEEQLQKRTGQSSAFWLTRIMDGIYRLNCKNKITAEHCVRNYQVFCPQCKLVMEPVFPVNKYEAPAYTCKRCSK